VGDAFPPLRTVAHLTPAWTEEIVGSSIAAAAKIVEDLTAPAGKKEWTMVLGLVDGDGKQHLFSFPCRSGDPEPFGWKPGMTLSRWGLRRLGPGVWTLSPSVHVHGDLHAYVTVVGVPEPAPFVGTDGG